MVCDFCSCPTVYAASSDNMIRGFNATTKELRNIYVGHKIGVTCLEICNNILYSASADTTAIAWDLAKCRWVDFQAALSCMEALLNLCIWKLRKSTVGLKYMANRSG